MIKEFRKQMGWSQQKLSEMTGIPRSTISECERDINRISPRKSELINFIISYGVRKIADYSYRRNLDLYREYLKEKNKDTEKNDLIDKLKVKSIWQRIKDWWLK